MIQVHVLSSTGEDTSSCVVHLINDGVVVDGYDVSIQFLGSRNVRSYLCKLDDDNFYPCERNRYEQLYIDYRMVRNFCGDFNLANWRIFY